MTGAIFPTPLLSESDPSQSAEGYLDPLGLYAIADSLGVRLAPGVRERQSHPRYLTAMAVAATVCADFDTDRVAADGLSPPWQVFEWYMVEGLVRTHREGEDLRGLPGRDKANIALRGLGTLSARTYLKTPSVFGFHGVYRLLAKALDMVPDERLGERGYQLVAEWEREQGLYGFLGGDREPGKTLRYNLAQAIKDGLKKGAVARKGGWSGWTFFHDHLHPARFGRRERRVVIDALAAPDEPLRSALWRFLTTSTGRQAWKNASEREFHQVLCSELSGEIRELVDAITLYERYARRLQDAFNDCLFELSRRRRQLDPSDLGALQSVEAAAKQIPAIYPELSDRLGPFRQADRFERTFQAFAARVTPRDWVVTLLDHHRRVQANKPPNGRAPWLEWFDAGKVMLRPAYLREQGGRHDDAYVHAYRTAPLHSFAHDLGIL